VPLKSVNSWQTAMTLRLVAEETVTRFGLLCVQMRQMFLFATGIGNAMFVVR
jgi:hypothetical protein